jgi:hypothetical protein
MSNLVPPADDLEAVRIIAGTLLGFSLDDQERIIRWVREKIGLSKTPTDPNPPGISPLAEGKELSNAVDIKSFIQQKTPNSDNEFAAVVAYFHRFVAKEKEQKEEISANDLQDATRKADYKRLKRPLDTLHNAFKSGLLDKGSGRGLFKINTVGENLVAMALPATGAEVTKHKASRVRKIAVKKKPNHHKAPNPKTPSKRR